MSLPRPASSRAADPKANKVSHIDEPAYSLIEFTRFDGLGGSHSDGRPTHIGLSRLSLRPTRSHWKK
jgi:hypothetical protein